MQEISHAPIPMSAMTNDDGDLELSDEDDDTIHDSITSAQIAEPEPVFFAPAGFRPNSFFVGREKEIGQLDKLFFDERRHNWDGTGSILRHAVGGAGKAQIARTYAFANREPTQVSLYVGDDRGVSEGVQRDIKVSKALLSRYDTRTNDDQLIRVHRSHCQRSRGMDSHNCIRLWEVPWLTSCLYMVSTEIHTTHGPPENQEPSGQRSYSQVSSKRKKLEY